MDGLMDSAVTVIVNVKPPARVGVPEILPLAELRINPGGNAPSLTSNV
jgi:hypothetical protein